ncbi:hypothetical protein PUR61_13520, partial [Streptomyces sp. BE20]
SPRLRGCSLVVGGEQLLVGAAPRACGAVPRTVDPRAGGTVCTPRLRGCSSAPQIPRSLRKLLPAPAGLFPGHG